MYRKIIQSAAQYRAGYTISVMTGTHGERSVNSIKLALILLLAAVLPASAQPTGPDAIREAEIPALVSMVDDELGLSKRQEEELQVILLKSYRQLSDIQQADLPDVEKLHLIRQNQAEADKALQELFTGEQYAAYRRFLHGETESGQMKDARSWEDRVALLADRLALDGDRRDRFTAILFDLERETAKILAESAPEQAGLDLLTAILASDILIIGLLDKSGYEAFHAERERGALTGTASEGGSDMETVLLFYDISQALGLTRQQTSSVIRLILEGEMEKRRIRQQYASSPALVQEKLSQFERTALMRLQAILDDKQVELLLELMDRQN
jgi:hypothetical protein